MSNKTLSKIPVAFLNGQFVKIKDARISIFDRGFTLGDGLFETLRAYNGMIFRLDLHLERFERGADALKIPLPYSHYKLRKILQSVAQKNGEPDTYIRLTLTRGETLYNPSLDHCKRPTLAIFAWGYPKIPQKYYKKGVAISLFPNTAQCTVGIRERIKTCSYLSSLLLRDQAARMGSFEAVLLKGNTQVTEGAVSNVFIIKNGILKTPKLNRWVLAGVTRHVTLEIARNLEIPSSEKLLKGSEVCQADEVFLTNTGIEILPVTRVDGCLITNGRPGPITRKLQRAFTKIIEAQVQSC